MLLIPDLLAYWLTGEIGAELTNASTTQLLDARRAVLGGRAYPHGRPARPAVPAAAPAGQHHRRAAAGLPDAAAPCR